MAKFSIGDSVLASGKDASIWAVHIYAHKVLYSVTFADGTAGRDVPEAEVEYSEIEKLRREVGRLKGELDAIKQRQIDNQFKLQPALDRQKYQELPAPLWLRDVYLKNRNIATC